LLLVLVELRRRRTIVLVFCGEGKIYEKRQSDEGSQMGGETSSETSLFVEFFLGRNKLAGEIPFGAIYGYG
jgi:hypothetical protein